MAVKIKAREEEAAVYAVNNGSAAACECDNFGVFAGIPKDEIIARALTLLDLKYNKAGALLGNPSEAGAFLRLKMRGLEHEIFACLWLDNRHRVLKFEEMFRGTVDGASVHPREVVKSALAVNACAVIFAHNHPSGVAEPSVADRAITTELCNVLQMVGVKVLDHMIIGEGEPVSMARRGLL